MEQKKDSPPASTSNQPGQGTTAAGSSTGTKVIEDHESGFGWRLHANASSPVQSPKRKRDFKLGILLPVMIIATLAVTGGVLAFFSRDKPPQGSKKAGLSLQSLGGDAVKSLTQAFSGGTRQVLTVNADTVFQKQVTFESDTKFNGQISGNKGININGAASFEKLNVRSNLTISGATSLQGEVAVAKQLTVNGALNVNSSGSFKGELSVSSNLSVGGNLSVVGSLGIGTITAQNISVGDKLTITGHITSDGRAPTITATDFIGSGGKVRLSGNDTAGTIVLNTGTNPSPGQLATIVFRRPFAGVPKVLITAVGMNASRLNIYTTRTALNFTFNSDTGPTNSTEYAFDYFVID